MEKVTVNRESFLVIHTVYSLMFYVVRFFQGKLLKVYMIV